VLTFKDSFKTLIVKVYNYEDNSVDKGRTLETLESVKTFRYHQSHVLQSDKKCEIIFPFGYIKEQKGDYFINIKEKGLLLDLKLSRILPPLSIKNDIIYQSKNGKEYLGWYIPLPRAKVTGKIVIDGKLIKVDGLSYHDHNWGNLNLAKHLKGWVWGRIFFNDFTLIFGDISSYTQRGEQQIILFIDQKGYKANIKSHKINYNEFDSQNQYNMKIPKNLSVEFVINDYYHIVLKKDKKNYIDEIPFGSFDNNFLNLWSVRLYHLLLPHYLPNVFRKCFGRLLYVHSEITGELFINDHLIDKNTGNIEAISFAD
jgi:hypothetical protein